MQKKLGRSLLFTVQYDELIGFGHDGACSFNKIHCKNIPSQFSY